MREGTSGYTSPIRVDDIIRLRVAERYKPSTPFVFVDIFEGTIQTITSEYGSKNTTVLQCRGHIDEAGYTLIEEAKTYTSATDATDILSYFVGKYNRRLEYNSLYADTGITFPEYSTTAYQTYLSDVFMEAEKNSGNSWFIDCIPVYDINKNLDTVYLSWSPLPTKPTTSYKIIEGTARYISSSFAASIEDMITYYRVLGDTPADTSTAVGTAVTRNAQYSGSYSNTSMEAVYGKRGLVDTFTWLRSNTQCSTVAVGVGPYKSTVVIAGTAKLIGTPQAHKGDLVTVKLKSTDVNGAAINANFTVFRVSRTGNGTDFTTSLDLGKIVKNAYDYIGQVSKTVKVVKKNQCKG